MWAHLNMSLIKLNANLRTFKSLWFNVNSDGLNLLSWHNYDLSMNSIRFEVNEKVKSNDFQVNSQGISENVIIIKKNINDFNWIQENSTNVIQAHASLSAIKWIKLTHGNCNEF